MAAEKGPRFVHPGEAEHSAVEQVHGLVPDGVSAARERQIISAMIASLEARREGIVVEKIVADEFSEWPMTAEPDILEQIA